MKRAIGLIMGAALGGCAAPTHYQGIALPVGQLPPEHALMTALGRGYGLAGLELSSLAAMAQAGNKHAQLELGSRFEEGRGVVQDWKRARRLYALAAARSGGTMMIYQPPVRKGGRGQVVPIDTGPVREGLPEAKLRQEALVARRGAVRYRDGILAPGS